MRTLIKLNELLDADPEPAWTFTEPGFDPTAEKEIGARLSISNGFLGVRGDLTTDPTLQKCYVAGYFRAQLGDAGIPGLAPAPTPFPLRVSVDDKDLNPGDGQRLDYSRSLDMKHGFLRTTWREGLAGERTVSVSSVRFCSLADRNLAFQVSRIRLSKPARVQI